MKIPWFIPSVGNEEKEALSKVIDSGYINDGNLTREFEKNIADFLGVKHCVAVTSGTAAISLSLLAAGVTKDDEVLVPDLTFIATANAVSMFGASVKLIDVDKTSFTIDPEKIRENISAKTKAIIPVDVNGRPANYESILKIADEHGLAVICDSAEALGSKYKGQHLGTFGKAGCFSFSANKTISTGQGGMVATNDEKLYTRLLELKDQGRSKQGTGGNDLHPVIGFNFKFTNIHAAVGLAQLSKLNSRLKKAVERNSWYKKLLDGIPGLSFISDNDEPGVITQWTDILIEDRDKLAHALDAEGIGNRPFWYPLHSQAPYKAPDSEFGSTIGISRQGLWLPSYFDLTENEAERTAAIIRKFLGR